MTWTHSQSWRQHEILTQVYLASKPSTCHSTVLPLNSPRQHITLNNSSGKEKERKKATCWAYIGREISSFCQHSRYKPIHLYPNIVPLGWKQDTGSWHWLISRTEGWPNSDSRTEGQESYSNLYNILGQMYSLLTLTISEATYCCILRPYVCVCVWKFWLTKTLEEWGVKLSLILW